MVMKKNVKLLGMVAMFSVTLASCTNDELKEVYQGEEISFTTRMTRAVETNSGNLKAFRVYAHAENYGNMFINHEMATKSDGNIFSLVSHTGGSFFWPSKVNNIEFWAYGPFTSTTSADSVKVDAEITSLSQQLQNFEVTPSMTEGGKGHKDLIVAYTKANRNTVSGMTVPLNFQHALSQIEVTAKCPDIEKTIKIKGAWLMNVKSSGTLVFSKDKEQDAYMDWHLNETLANYGVAVTPVTLQNKYTTFIGGDTDSQDNTSLMLIPQSSNKWDKETNSKGAYILLLCRVEATHQGKTPENGTIDDVISTTDNTHTHQLFPTPPAGTEYNANQYGYTCVAIAPNWEHGKKYKYNLEFCGANSGAGVYPPLNVEDTPNLPDKNDNIIPNNEEDKVGLPILDNPIKFSVDVTPWGNANSSDVPMD